MKKRTGSSNIDRRSSSLKVLNRARSTLLCSSNRRKSSQLPPNSVARPRTAVVTQHATGLCHQHLGTVQVAGRGPGQQLRVGHARPEEVAQAAGQVVIRQRPDARARARADRRGSRSGATSSTLTIVSRTASSWLSPSLSRKVAVERGDAVALRASTTGGGRHARRTPGGPRRGSARPPAGSARPGEYSPR